MTIDFHHIENRSTYATRDADQTWEKIISEIIDVKGKKVLDSGCGGGIYSKSITTLGADSVVGLDFSESMLNAARENCQEYSNISFVQGNVIATGLESQSFDVILKRAVIHHFKDITTNFLEAYRLLKTDGVCLVQDRTPEDCFLPGSSTHIRGYFFEKYPELIQKETSRRYSSQSVVKALGAAGFNNIKEFTFWETRKIYNQIADLETDLYNRTGRSILHELSDSELRDLIEYIKINLSNNNIEQIIEKDRWTIWVGQK